MEYPLSSEVVPTSSGRGGGAVETVCNGWFKVRLHSVDLVSDDEEESVLDSSSVFDWS
mgnify:CR=1 FL=1